MLLLSRLLVQKRQLRIRDPSVRHASAGTAAAKLSPAAGLSEAIQDFLSGACLRHG